MRDTVLTILFLVMLAVCLTAFVYPWSFRNRVARVLVHLPLLLVALYGIYEALMPVEMNIRLDMDILLPAFGLAFLCYVVKLPLLLFTRRKSGDDAANADKPHPK